MRDLSAIYPGKVIIDGNNPDGTFKNETTPDVTNDGTPNDEKWAQDMWGFFAHLLNKAGINPDGVQENEATSQLYDSMAIAARNIFPIWDATNTYPKGVLAVGSDGLVYQSLQAANLNNDPTVSPAWWVDHLSQSTTSSRGISYLFNRIITETGTDADHDINFLAGTFKFGDGSGMAIGPAYTKQLDATWAAGDAAGGLADALVIAADTTYHLFALSDDNGTSDYGFDTSLTAVNLLADTAVIAAGLTKWARIGSRITDGTAAPNSNFLPMFQIGKRFYFGTRLNDVNLLGAGNGNSALRTLTVPLGVATVVILNLSLVVAGAAQELLVTSPDEVDIVPTPVLMTVQVANGNREAAQIDVKTNIAQQVRTRASTPNVTEISLTTLGWIDEDLED